MEKLKKFKEDDHITLVINYFNVTDSEDEKWLHSTLIRVEHNGIWFQEEAQEQGLFYHWDTFEELAPGYQRPFLAGWTKRQQ